MYVYLLLIDCINILQYVQVKATLSVIEDERNRFLAKLLEEENVRQSLEGKCITSPVHLGHQPMNDLHITALNLRQLL